MANVEGDTVELTRENDKLYIDGQEVTAEQVPGLILGLQTNPKIPAPFAWSKPIAGKKFQCKTCHENFETRMVYRGHYAVVHIFGL